MTRSSRQGWQGAERIDNFMMTRSWEVERSGLSLLKLSDHCLVHTTVNMEDCEPEPTTKIRTGVDWRAPLGSSKQRWRNTLEKAWEEGGSKKHRAGG